MDDPIGTQKGTVDGVEYRGIGGPPEAARLSDWAAPSRGRKRPERSAEARTSRPLPQQGRDEPGSQETGERPVQGRASGLASQGARRRPI